MDHSSIRINEKTLQETVSNITLGFPYMSELVDMHSLPGDSFPWHWHGEVEFFYGLQGEVEYHVPGSMQVFRPGDAGFINANVLHMTHAPNPDASLQIEHLFLPEFIFGQAGSDIEARYIRPVLRKKRLDLYRFDPPDRAIELMRQANELHLERREGFELHIRALMSELWLELFRQTRSFHADNPLQDLDDSRIKQMLAYISDHCSQKLSLAEIAQAGYVGERECFRIFRRNLNMTPLDYLVRKRLDLACEHLKNTSLPVQDIAMNCGFNSNSYFTKVFREHLGLTPREYRKNLKDKKEPPL